MKKLPFWVKIGIAGAVFYFVIGLLSYFEWTHRLTEPIPRIFYSIFLSFIGSWGYSLCMSPILCFILGAIFGFISMAMLGLIINLIINWIIRAVKIRKEVVIILVVLSLVLSIFLLYRTGKLFYEVKPIYENKYNNQPQEIKLDNPLR